MTNIAELVRKNQDKLSKIKHCYIMGGSSNALGNVTKFAEYNFRVDPEAADIVFSAQCEITMVGLDVTNNVFTNKLGRWNLSNSMNFL